MCINHIGFLFLNVLKTQLLHPSGTNLDCQWKLQSVGFNKLGCFFYFWYPNFMEFRANLFDCQPFQFLQNDEGIQIFNSFDSTLLTNWKLITKLHIQMIPTSNCISTVPFEFCFGCFTTCILPSRLQIFHIKKECFVHMFCLLSYTEKLML